jgi:putative transposase
VAIFAQGLSPLTRRAAKPKSVYSFYMRAKQRGTWEEIMKMLIEKDRVAMGRKAQPSYSLIDWLRRPSGSQSVKTTDKAVARGIDGGKKVKWRKRHIGFASLRV